MESGKADKNDLREEMLKRKKSLVIHFKKTKSSPCDLEEREVARDSVQAEMKELAARASMREQELKVLHDRMAEFICSKQAKHRLEEKERTLESEYEDLESLLIKLRKEVRLLGEEDQIKRGKTVVEYNRVVELRDEQATQ